MRRVWGRGATPSLPDADPARCRGVESESSLVCLGDALDDRQAEADTSMVGADELVPR